MTTRFQVRCINKADQPAAHERIQRIGGVKPDGSGWGLSPKEAIAGIENGQWEFFVHIGGHTARVVVAKSATGQKYLKTEADAEEPSTLLKLPDCPF